MSGNACLRCRLHDVLRSDLAIGTEVRAIQTNVFGLATTPGQLIRRYTTEAQARQPSIRWKTIHPQGRIVGSGRKRQRIVSTELVRKSLDKTANVIVLRDVQDDARNRVATSQARDGAAKAKVIPQLLSAQDVENAITGAGPAPNEIEINASIDSLQPEESMLETPQFRSLSKQLTQGYTLTQLLSYLRTRLLPSSAQANPQATKQNSEALQTSPWQPHRTPLETRRAKMVRPTVMSRKARAAERIIRLAWKVTIHSEEQEIGELEVALKPWQLAMLFDLTSTNGRPYYESFIAPQLLLNATEIQQYRPDSILRITGRRRDAEEVAYQLEMALSEARKLQLDLSKLTTAFDVYLTDQEMALVSIHTKSVIASHARNTIVIYNRTEAGANHARRSLLSILNGSSLSDGENASVSTLQLAGWTTKAERLRLPIYTTAGLHIRDKDLDLGRRVSVAAEVPPDRRDELATSMAVGLREAAPNLKALNMNIEPQVGYWSSRGLTAARWQAGFVHLLEPRRMAEDSVGSITQHVVQRRVPSVEDVIDRIGIYQAPNRGRTGGAFNASTDIDQRLPQLTAHLVPAPADRKDYGVLPRIEMRFGFLQGDREKLVFMGMRAITHTRLVKAPLPSHAVDLLFTQRQSMFADTDAALHDTEIAAFVATLQQSVQAAHNALAAPPELTIKLPAWCSGARAQKEPKATKREVSVTYLLERFEQTQRRTFVPRSEVLFPEDKELKPESVDNKLRLEYKEMEGGVVFGAGSALNLKTMERMAGESMDDGKAGMRGEGNAKDGTYQIVRTALAIADCLTKGAQGTLKDKFSAS